MTKRQAPTKPALRCAIYTRKSSEDGLDQAFNSLDAQREACEAYIKSQSHEGWRVLPALYDDGGFSGGNLDRPALKRLLTDIDAGRIDTVVVYKIDRLTRALSDFAKIVDRLDAAGASFVSVTQAFNTTTSMGRLTLNVLLSFAQFEREVTGERIRDKIAASKKKGMWMGGNPPLGYDPPTDLSTRALVVNPTEAEQVRLIFRRYVELGSVSHLVRWLDAEEIRSKAYVTRSGRRIGGATFSRGALFHLLSNRTYLGEIRHKDQHYPGAHPPIVDQALFDAVQAALAANTTTHKARPTRVSTMPLKGMIFDADGSPMSPTFGHGNQGRIYRYYVSAPLQQGIRRSPGDDAIRRLPAEAIEDVVLDRLTSLPRAKATAAMNWGSALHMLMRIEVQAGSVQLLIKTDALVGPHADLEMEIALLSRRLGAGERMFIDPENATSIRWILPIRLKPRGGRCWITTPDGSPTIAKPRVDRALMRGLRSAYRLMATSGAEGSTGRVQSTQYERKLRALVFLAPDIQRAILEGRQPIGFNLEQLVHGEIPLAWADQRALFGF